MSLIRIIITKSDHSINVPQRMDTLLSEMIRRSGYRTGEFKVFLGERVYGTNHTRGIKVLNYSEESKSFMVRAQPGGNNSCHNCTVFIAQEFQENALEFYESVKLAHQKNDAKEEKEPRPKKEIFRPKTPHYTDGDAKRFLPLNELISQEKLIELITALNRISSSHWIKQQLIFNTVKRITQEYGADVITAALLGNGFLEPNRLNRSRLESRLTDKAKALIIVAPTIETPKQVINAFDITQIKRLREAAEKYQDIVEEISTLEAERKAEIAEALKLEERLAQLRNKVSKRELRLKDLIAKKTLSLARDAANWEEIIALTKEVA